MRICLIMAVLLACKPDFTPTTLAPYPNPFGSDDPLWSKQPHRDNPLEIAVTSGAVWVSLQGSNDLPGHEIARVDRSTGEVTRIDTEGSSPTGLAKHPTEPLLLVFNRFSNFVTVVDTDRGKVVDKIESDFYAVEGVFSPDGEALWITNRWRDAVAVWNVSIHKGKLQVDRRKEPGVPVGTNPRDLAISPDGAVVAVGSLTGMDLALIDTQTRKEIRRIDVGAPVNGLAFAGHHLVIATTSASTHHAPFDGPDTNHDGLPGDGTPNVNFQDLQNELLVVDGRSGESLWRYTSDTLCCRDFRDVHTDDLDRYGDFHPPEDQWIVGGALPEQVVAKGQTVWVTYSGSNEFQSFEVDPTTGRLSPGEVRETSGHNPHGIALAGDELYITHRLGETLGHYGPTGNHRQDHTVGDLSGGAFPATDAEVGELFNFVTAPFTVDGDQTCAHCHREGSNIDKAFSMPLTRYGGVGSRMTMAYRGAADTRPWFMESAFDETNFKPVMNEFARIENFCCEDYTLWPNGAPADCASNPPPECADVNASSLDGFAAARGVTEFVHNRPTGQPSRDRFYLQRAQEVIGRTESFGDGVYREDPITQAKVPLPLNFDGITRSLGLFLLNDTHLLPNPNRLQSDAAQRGKAVFESSEAGCMFCHPSPTFAASTQNNPFEAPIRMGPVVSPNRAEDGTNVDLFAAGFIETFPRSEQDTCEQVCGDDLCQDDANVCDDLRNVYFGVTTLRGLWDRADSMLHDGRAQGLREVLCTPGHPALLEGEQGFNEVDGIPDVHGGTSHLSEREIEDLIVYINAL